MIQPPSARLSAVVALLAGVLWLTLTLFFPLKNAVEKGITISLGLIFFTLVIAMMTIPGIFAIYGGYSLLRKKTKRTIKTAVGATSILLATIGAGLLPGPLHSIAYLPTLLAISLPLYILWSKAIIKREELEPPRPGEFIGSGIIAAIAFVIYSTLSESIDLLYPQGNSPKKAGHLGEAAFVFGPILAAVLFYKVAIFFWIQRTTR